MAGVVANSAQWLSMADLFRVEFDPSAHTYRAALCASGALALLVVSLCPCVCCMCKKYSPSRRHRVQKVLMVDDTVSDEAVNEIVQQKAPQKRSSLVDGYTMAFIMISAGFKGRTALKDAVHETAQALCAAAGAFSDLEHTASALRHEVQSRTCFNPFAYYPCVP
jgi:hypothetical protein